MAVLVDIIIRKNIFVEDEYLLWLLFSLLFAVFIIILIFFGKDIEKVG
jgi:hypothetical protein